MADTEEKTDRSKLEKVIDIDKVVAAKVPERYQKWVPDFAVNYLKKVLHEDDLNYFMSLYGKLQGKPFAEAILKHFEIGITIEGEENLPQDGRAIFASNHPLGGLDGVALLNFLNGHYPVVKSPVNDVLMNVRQLTCYFVPVNKLGNQSREGAAELYDSYAADDAILFFPAGMCSRRQEGGVIADLEWKKTFVQKAVQYKRDIVPIHFIGQNSKFFYNLGYWRKKIGLKKVNIEMLYLVDELYKARGSHFTIKVGKPIPHDTFDKNVRSYADWAQWVKEKVYKI